jgi:hypothetical protein
MPFGISPKGWFKRKKKGDKSAESSPEKNKEGGLENKDGANDETKVAPAEPNKNEPEGTSKEDLDQNSKSDPANAQKTVEEANENPEQGENGETIAEDPENEAKTEFPMEETCADKDAGTGKGTEQHDAAAAPTSPLGEFAQELVKDIMNLW